MTFNVPSSWAGATPAATPADAPAAIPAAPPAPTAPDPMVVADPVAGTGATAYPADLPPITSLSMLRSQPPFAWKLDLPGRKRAREEFVATTWEVEVETQDGPREPPLKIYSPMPSRSPTLGGGWEQGETIIALYAYRLRGGHWRMDCCDPESVVPGYQAALYSHDVVERRYPGDALVEGVTNPAFEPPAAHAFGTSTGTATL